MPLVVVDDIEMYYESRGSGPALVVIGGLGLEMSELGTLVDPLASSFRVVAFDNRGAGRSSKPRGPYSIEQMAGDVAGLIDRLDLPRAHVLGISMGGKIAMALAFAHPERVDHLVLVSTGPRAAGARWLVRLGMLVSDLPLLRGCHRQPRYALKAQFDATSTFDCSERLVEIKQPTLPAWQIRPHRTRCAGRADARPDPELSPRPVRGWAPVHLHNAAGEVRRGR